MPVGNGTSARRSMATLGRRAWAAVLAGSGEAAALAGSGEAAASGRGCMAGEVYRPERSFPSHGRGAGASRREPEDAFVDQVEVPGVAEGAGRQAEGEVHHEVVAGRQCARQAMAGLPLQEVGGARLAAA